MTRALLLLLVATVGITIITAELFDVTTIYRFEDTLADKPSKNSFLDIPSCYVEDGGDCGWNVSDFDLTDNMKAYAVKIFPSRDYNGSYHSVSKVSVFKISSKEVSVEVKPTQGPITMYFMTGEDVYTEDLIVVNMYPSSQRGSEVYKCLVAKKGVQFDLPGAGWRECVKVDTGKTEFSMFSYWDTASYTDIRVTVTQNQIVAETGSKKHLFFRINLSEMSSKFLGKIKYIGVTLVGNLRHLTPVTVLSLDDNYGMMSTSMPATTESFALLCLEMKAYIDPNSGGSVTVLYWQEDETSVLGRLSSSNSEEAETWKFFGEIDVDPTKPWKLAILVEKSSREAVLLTNITRCRDQDITYSAIHLQSSVAIHGRNNARGLPFATDENFTQAATTGVDLTECSGSKEKCDWTINNWIRLDVSALVPKPDLKLDRGILDYAIEPTQRTKSIPFQDDLIFISNIRDFKLFLTDSRDVIASSSSYYFYFKTNGQDYKVYLYRCMPSYYGQSNTGHPGIAPYGCQLQVSRTLRAPKPIASLPILSSVIVTVSIKGAAISLSVRIGTLNLDPANVLSFTDGSPIKIEHFSFASVTSNGVITTQTEQPVLSLSETTGSLTSPWTQPQGDEICVSLEVFMEDRSSSIQLAVETKDSVSDVQAHFQPKESELGAWSRHRLMLALPGGSRGKKVRVVATGSRQRGKLLVQRIAGCSAQEEILKIASKARTVVRSPGFDVSQTNRSFVLEHHASCENGGMMETTHAQCVCPAGFTGSACAEGCGANRYGDDCGGVCSLSLRGCRNMVMCRPQLGCRCAPGYKGLLCDTECEAGEYGAGCRQRCGRCAGETCDIYTGVCHDGCVDGRFPPFCQKLYKHLSEAPVVKLHGYDTAVVSADLTNTHGHGKPVSFQIQVKEAAAADWTSLTPQRVVAPQSAASATSREVGRVTGLKSGVRHLVRVLLIDVTGRSYEGKQVPVTQFTTNCIVPDSVNYQLESPHQWESGINVTWKYPADNSTWCPLLNHEVRLSSGLLSVVSATPADAATSTSFSDLLPGVEYRLQVTAITSRGPAAASQPITARTSEQAPDHVIDLHVTQGVGRALQVSWKEPRRPGGVIKRYQLSYQCLHLLGCPGQSCAGSQGHVESMATSSVISGLLPHAVYKVTVAGVSGSVGPTTALLAATNSQPAEVSPAASARPVSSRTNSTLTVHWEAPSAANCSDLNGYLLGYRYELTKPPQLVPMLEATTTNTSATFTQLEPHAHYLVKVYVVTEDGWSSAHALEIPAKTRATTPGEVRDLVAYSRDRRRLGLRWREPRLTYGALESFTFTVARGDVTPVSVSVAPQRCAAWPLLFCHTVRDLQSDANYSITVQARNSEVAEDGDEAVIFANTKETAPEAPTYAGVFNLTSESATIEWGIPNMINGKLRSFLISIEETDSANSAECCQNFPLREMAVSAEQATYHMQLTGLNPASSYAVSVSAKTVAMGPAVTLNLHTRPRAPVLTAPPRLLQQSSEDARILVEVTPYVPDQLVSRYLLFIEGRSSDIWSHDDEADSWLADQISATTNQSLTLAAEFTHAAILSTNTVSVELRYPLVDGGTSTGKPRSAKDSHRLLLALVLDYNGSVGVGFIWSEPFLINDSTANAD